MKIPLLPALCLGLCLFLVPAQAKHKKHHNGQPDDGPTPAPQTAVPNAAPEAAPAIAPEAMPSASLQPFLDLHLAKILAPLGQPGMDQPEVVTSLKAAYGDGLATAPAARKPAYAAAANVCDTLTSAMTERRQAAAALVGSTATHSSEAVQPRGGRAAGNATIRTTDDFFVNSQKASWVQRAGLLRQNIMTAYQRERAFERQIPPAPDAGAAPGTPTTPANPALAAATPAAPTPSVSAPVGESANPFGHPTGGR